MRPTPFWNSSNNIFDADGLLVTSVHITGGTAAENAEEANRIVTAINKAEQQVLNVLQPSHVTQHEMIGSPRCRMLYKNCIVEVDENYDKTKLLQLLEVLRYW